MKFRNELINALKDWHEKSHQRWKDEQDNRRGQELDYQARQTASALTGELATVFRGKSYQGLRPIDGMGNLRYTGYHLQKDGRIRFIFSAQKSINCDLPPADLAIIKCQMNQDINNFKHDIFFYEGDIALATFYPCIFSGACVIKIVNSPRSSQEVLIYVM